MYSKNMVHKSFFGHCSGLEYLMHGIKKSNHKTIYKFRNDTLKKAVHIVPFHYPFKVNVNADFCGAVNLVWRLDFELLLWIRLKSSLDDIVFHNDSSHNISTHAKLWLWEI